MDSDRLGEKEDSKKRSVEAEDQTKKKSEQKQMRDDDERLKVIETCEVLVRSVLAFGTDHINNPKVNDLRVLLCYHLEPKKFNGIPKKVELVEAFTDLFLRIGRVLHRGGEEEGVVCCDKWRC